ncbi:MAG: transglycosylase SLT domain-containing protein [Clostridia bacterium]
MIRRPLHTHDLDDDEHAPVDYRYVPSVSAGRRIEQERNIKREAPDGAVVRHRADPFQRGAVDAYGTRERQTRSDARQNLGPAKKLPSMADGPAPAASIAYPQDYGIPENPFEQPQEASTARPMTGARIARPQAAQAMQPAPTQAQPMRGTLAQETPETYAPPMVTEDGSQFDPPAAPPMPEWLRVAQQNNMPMEERARPPRVQAAPRHEVDELPAVPPTDPLGRPLRSRAAQTRQNAAAQAVTQYEQAGYPPELLAQQQQLERQKEEQGTRRRHGAQYAVNQYRQQEYRQSVDAAANARASYPPARTEHAGGQVESQPASPQWNGAEQSRGAAYAMAAAQEAPQYAHRPRASARSADVDAWVDDPYVLQEEDENVRRAAPANEHGYARRPAAHRGAPQSDAWVDEESDAMPMYQERSPIPWLGISVFVAALLAVGLWLMQLTFTAQTEQVIRERQENTAAMRNNHPLRYQELIEREATRNNLDPAFVAAIVLNESSFNPKAESGVGARGLMQLVDKTADWVYQKMGLTDGYSFDAMYDAETNVRYGCWYLAFLCERFRADPVLVSAAYHAGQNEVQNWLNSSKYSADGLTLALDNMMDGPTKQYATRVVRDYAIYKRLYYETTEEAT